MFNLWGKVDRFVKFRPSAPQKLRFRKAYRNISPVYGSKARCLARLIARAKFL